MSRKNSMAQNLWVKRRPMLGAVLLLAAYGASALKPKVISHLAQEHEAAATLWPDSSSDDDQLEYAFERAAKFSQVKATLDADPEPGTSPALNRSRLSVRASTGWEALHRLHSFIDALKAEYKTEGPGILHIISDDHATEIRNASMRRADLLMAFAVGICGGVGLALLGSAALSLLRKPPPWPAETPPASWPSSSAVE
jgi:hypothetical protein